MSLMLHKPIENLVLYFVKNESSLFRCIKSLSAILVEQLIRAVISGPQLLVSPLAPHPGCHRVHVDRKE